MDTQTASVSRWVGVCASADILPNTGVAALVADSRGAKAKVAVFRVVNATQKTERFFAIGERDPFTGANVLSRGIVGDAGGVSKVASPLLKQSFNLATGVCLDDDGVSVPTYAVRVNQGQVEIGMA